MELDIQIWQIVLIIIYAFIMQLDMLSFDIGLGRPIQAGLVTGTILGDPVSGLIIGGTLQLLILGVGTYGGSSIPDYATAAIIGTILGAGNDVNLAISIAVPVGLLLIQLDILARFSNTYFGNRIDKHALNGNIKGIERMHLMGMLSWGLSRAIPVLFVLIFGQKFIDVVLKYIPDWLMGGLTVAGGLLPIVGVVILLRYLPIKKFFPYFLLGFALVAYFKISMLGASLFGLIAAVLVFKNISSKQPQLTAVTNTPNIEEEGEYDE